MNLQQQLGEWYPLLSHVFDTEWMQKLGRRLWAAEDIQPDLSMVFRAFKLCPPSKVKVVIIGQDPYINGEADGLAFSSYGKMTPSLEVIFAEINRTHPFSRTQTHLDDWAVQGVFLLNSVLTTRMGKSKAHEGWGWETFVHEVLQVIATLPQPIVLLCWGTDAKHVTSIFRKRGMDHRLNLLACHPQAQNYNSANKFVGCNHFVEANVFLIKQGIKPIWWGDPMYDPDIYAWIALLDHLKQLSHVETHIIEKLRSYPAVPSEPHPFSEGLEPGYKDDLPF